MSNDAHACVYIFCNTPVKANLAWRTAPHCNALQQTTTHCNTLQPIATHCNTPMKASLAWRTATYHNKLQHTATHCNTLQHTATHCNTLQHVFLAERDPQLQGILFLCIHSIEYLICKAPWASFCNDRAQKSTVGWRTCTGCLIVIHQFPQKSPIISGELVERDLQIAGDA